VRRTLPLAPCKGNAHSRINLAGGREEGDLL
jgi:hypothetical protein